MTEFYPKFSTITTLNHAWVSVGSDHRWYSITDAGVMLMADETPLEIMVVIES